MKTSSIVIVLIQLGCMIYIALSGPFIPKNPVAIALITIGIILAVWAVIEMRVKFSIFPELLPDSKLVTSGPYRFVRHPMYSAIILITFGWILEYNNTARFIAWMVLVITHTYKMNLEEQILTKTYKDYPSYALKTKRLIPFIY